MQKELSANPVVNLRDAFLAACNGAGYTLNLLFDTILWFRAIPKKKNEIVNYMSLATFGSMPVTFIVAMFSGMILALQTGVEFRRYGQEATIGTVVAAAVCRDLGPVMTCFALAGLIGSTIASEIATMKVSEEIDALEVMSINPVYYLVMPRVITLALVAPLLTIFSDLIGILGGEIVGYYVFNVDFDVYFQKARGILELKDVYGGLLKSIVFGITISTIACSQGLRAENGAVGVGQATLRTVVLSFIFILIFDYFLTGAIYR